MKQRFSLHSPSCLRLRPTLIAGLIATAAFMTLPVAKANEGVVLPDSPGPTELALYDGHWDRIPDDDEDASRLRSIEAAIDSLSWIVRTMASGILKKTTVPPPEMSFSWDGENLHEVVRREGGDSLRQVRLDDIPEILTDSRGEDFSSTWTWTETGLQVNWSQRQAYGTNLYRVDDRDQTLRVEHRIQITAVSDVDPIVFHSHFARTELPAVAAAGDRETRDTPVSSDLR
ncbi:MAG: hypothetical protein CL933_01550 [Deltaproteobacteria bacterium]|nr:hypothetical protein [Deltaproteobacteria bacterium]